MYIVPKEVACVRSSIYANMSVWSLFQAYKRIDDDQGLNSIQLENCHEKIIEVYLLNFFS